MCNVVETKAPDTSLQDIPVIQEFPDIFSKEIPAMLPPREVEFCIGLIQEPPHLQSPLQNGPSRA